MGGVAGARPGSRPGGRSTAGRAGGRPGLEGLGRWVEDRFDWLLEDEDDWREPWQAPPRPQEPERPAAPDAVRGRSWQERTARSGRPEPEPEPSQRPGRRQPLEAISRRATPLLPAQAPAAARSDAPVDADDWPDPDDFSVPRWQRPAQRRDPLAAPPEARERFPGSGSGSGGAGSRPLPRSTRRRG